MITALCFTHKMYTVLLYILKAVVYKYDKVIRIVSAADIGGYVQRTL